MRQSLNIGFDAKRAFLNSTGLGSYSRNTIRSLAKYYPGNGYFLFTPERNEQLFSPPSNAALIVPESVWWSRVRPLWRRYKVTELAQKSGLDIFHGLSHELPFGIEKTGIKTVVTMHDLIFLRFPNQFRAIDRAIYFRKCKHASHIADRIIAISQQTKQDLIHYFKVPETKIDVVYQSVNPIFFQKSTPEELDQTRNRYHLPDRFLLAPGTIEARKNLGCTLRALDQGDIPVSLVVAGKPTRYMKSLRPLIRKLGNRVIFLHNLTDAELSHLYQLAEATVYPSFFEGFGLPVAEAQACGCPVITSNISSLPEVGGEAALYINPAYPEEIAAAIRRILEDPSSKNEMKEKGRQNAERFQAKTYAQTLLNIYQNVHHA
ncbi:glycosyltransferase family 4 protein [Gaoshiqia sediminis]|uniref:Glycosyltransferase family 4 protein n=1 Tax=Gaoshiqia sediminis TaxID=2986998 RepID=A0AA42C912_9BACT|nr:glycosyltransferase family 1 protein [Gaoshiqia sediminis]MCW0481535.1 glycosyltransferase family 4 protein [Gaoshiqia sediminis]